MSSSSWFCRLRDKMLHGCNMRASGEAKWTLLRSKSGMCALRIPSQGHGFSRSILLHKTTASCWMLQFQTTHVKGHCNGLVARNWLKGSSDASTSLRSVEWQHCQRLPILLFHSAQSSYYQSSQAWTAEHFNRQELLPSACDMISIVLFTVYTGSVVVITASFTVCKLKSRVPLCVIN